MKRVNDAGAIWCALANYGLQQDWTKAKELYARAVKLSSSDAHYPLGSIYDESERGDLKKAKIHYEEAAIAGHKTARYNIQHWNDGL